MGRTTIQVSEELADNLHSRKGRGESYEDVIWSLIKRAESGAGEPDESDVQPPREPPEAPPDESPAPEEREEQADSGRDMAWLVAQIDIQGGGLAGRERHWALAAILEELAERGSATTAELKAIADEFEHDYQDTDAFWSNAWRRGAAEQLADRGLVESGGQGSNKWYWTGDE